MRVVPAAYKIMLSRCGAHTKTVCFSPCRRTNEFRNHILLCGEFIISQQTYGRQRVAA